MVILGAGALGKSALEIFKGNDVIVFGFLDDSKALENQEIDNVPVLGKLYEESIIGEIGKSAEAFIAIDENTVRKKLTKNLKKDREAVPVNAIHYTSLIPESVELGFGNLIDAGVILGADSKIGSNCLIKAGARIDVGAQLGDFVQVGVGSNINAEVTVEDEVFIGSGVTIVASAVIGKGARIGAGSVVVENVEAGSTVFGNPAKSIG